MPSLHLLLDTIKKESFRLQVNPITSQEARLLTRIQFIKNCTIFLILLASASLVGGIVCSIYLSPVFASLILATVLLSIAALAAHHWVSQRMPKNWIHLLTSYFHKLSAATAANSFECFGNHLTVWQHRHNDNMYLAIPRYTDEIPYSLFLPVLYRATLLNRRNYLKFLVNPIHPHQPYIDCQSNPSSQAIYASLSINQQQQQSSHPFLPTETRITPMISPPSMPQKKRLRSPNFLIHTRGPMLSECTGTKQEITNQYYLRALLSYKNILKQTVGTQSLHTVVVPLFSFVYEKNDDFSIIDPIAAEQLCLSALIQAMNSLAYTQPRKLLIFIQLATSNPVTSF